MTKKAENYSIGLDIGTNSVGWAVIDNDYHLLKHKSKNMWGVRLFEEGATAKDRRLSRGSRRRLKRRKQRIALLKELIGEIVLEKDQNFFMRLEKGYADKEDKGYDYNLFIETEFTDIDYYNQFKTIYHLRKYLCTSKEKADPRLIYLALHHIIKYRGNFLFEGQEFELSKQDEVIESLKNGITQIYTCNDIEDEFTDEEAKTILDVLVNIHIKKAERREQVNSLLLNNISKDFKDKKTFVSNIARLLVGDKSTLSKIYPGYDLTEDDKEVSIDFSSGKYEEKLDFLENALEDMFESLSELHTVYSYIVLQEIMDGSTSLCDAMIKKYETHEQDLAELKKLIKKYFSRIEYQEMFKDKNKVGNYYSYINNKKKVTKREFSDFVVKFLNKNEKIKDLPVYKNILDKIDRDIYMPKQTSKDNGAIPYQLNKMELEKIIDNQGVYYPVLKENKEKLIKILMFRIPYYVGPLNVNAHSDFHWAIRNTDEKIVPWEFDKQVDLIGSAEKFIRKMTNKCSYLFAEDVIPKKSLLYSKFEVLNELNKVKVNGKLIVDPTIKQKILNEVFLKRKKVKETDIEEFYIKNQLIDADSEFKIEGLQKEKEFATSLEPWYDFKKIYGEEFDEKYDEIETIIEWITVYEDKKILKKRIKEKFKDLDERKLKMILKKNYSGWGRLSKKLLSGIKKRDEFGNYVSIIEVMEKTNLNFMQVINNKKLGFGKAIDDENMDGLEKELTYKQVEELQGSPAIKKAIWQTIQIVKEIIKIMGHEPENIFMEFARNEDEKKRTDSRLKKLQTKYAAMKKEFADDEDFKKSK